MMNRRDFGKLLGAIAAVALLPFKASATLDVQYHTTFTSPIPAEEIGFAPKWYPPDGLVEPVPILPGDIVFRGHDGIEKNGKSRWVWRDGNRVFLGLHDEASQLIHERAFAIERASGVMRKDDSK